MPEMTSFVVSTALAIISFGFHLWQHHKYTKRIEALHHSLSAWLYWARSMRRKIDRHWNRVGRNPSPETLAGMSRTIVDDLAEDAGNIGRDIERTIFEITQADPYERPWIKAKSEPNIDQDQNKSATA